MFSGSELSHHLVVALDSPSSEVAATSSIHEKSQNKLSEVPPMTDERGTNGIGPPSQPVAVRHDTETAARNPGTMPAACVLDLVGLLA